MRLDAYLSQCGYYESRSKAAEAIRRGDVLVNGVKQKASFDVCEDGIKIEIVAQQSFVSEGGKKLQRAFDDFNFDVQNMVFADFGASTGGFTDCLLQHGAKSVFAIDVGESQLHPSLAVDSRVCVMDNTNARYLTKNDFPCEIDGAVMDVSFISQKLMYGALSSVVKQGGAIVTLVKPQFECGRSALTKTGIVKSKALHVRTICDLIKEAARFGLTAQALTVAPIREKKNVEYVLMLSNGGTAVLTEADVKKTVCP